MSKIPQEAIELLPCPFCGEQAERIDIDDGDNAGGSFICCTACQASGNIEFGYKENFVSNWNRRADAARAQGAEVAVKPLEWRKGYCDEIVEIQNASFGGSYQIRALQGEIWVDWPPRSATRFPTEEEAIAAVQADYEQRVRSALTTPPAPQPTDREKVLEDALQPFAKLAKVYDPDEGDDEDKCWVHEYTPTLGDLRRARAALAGGEA